MKTARKEKGRRNSGRQKSYVQQNQLSTGTFDRNEIIQKQGLYHARSNLKLSRKPTAAVFTDKGFK